MITRRVAIQGLTAWNFGLGELCKKRYGQGINKTLAFFDGNKTDYFFDKKQHKRFNDNLDKKLSEHEFVMSMIAEGTIFLEDMYEIIYSLIQNTEGLSNEELVKRIRKVSTFHHMFFTRKDVAWRITSRIEKKLKKKINETKLRKLSEPLKPNDVTDERIDLLKLAVKRPALKSIELETELIKHYKKYTHIPMFDSDHEPYTLEHFRENLNKVENPITELNEIIDSFEKKKTEFNNNILERMLQKAVIYRDFADTIRQKLNFKLIPFYEDIGKRIGLSREEVTLLTDNEIIYSLSENKDLVKEIVKKRKKAFLLIQDGKKQIVYSGEEAIKKAEQIKLYPQIKNKKIEGIVASKGDVKGTVKIVFTNKDLGKIKEGDIIVTTMTRQDFVPYLRKAKAIVTNEGGMGCHAAIIARELKVPCIVGTKIGTQILKDNDLIEVDGTNGIIRKL